MSKIFLISAMLCIAGCASENSEGREETLDAFESRLAQVYYSKPSGYSRAYAIKKNSMAGPTWLASVHAYPDNKSVCEQLIAPYNSGELSSVLPGEYYCEELAPR